MDQEPLVNLFVEEGRRLIERLVEEGVPVKAAGWLHEVYDRTWFLYIATPLVSEDGDTLGAYRRIGAVMRGAPEPFIGPFEIKVVNPHEPVGLAMQDLQRRYPGRPLIYFRGPSLGGVIVEGAYIYPPVAAPVR
jgi:hypothetical protein